MTLALSMCGFAYADSSFYATATDSYISGDVDGNGTVDLADLAYIQQFLNGSVAADARTAERLDVTRDYIIDANDKNYISNMLLNNTAPSTFSYPSNLSELPAQISGGVSYNIYDADDESYEGMYTLPPLSNISATSTTSTNTRGIIGTDDRVIENGLLGVINIQDSSNNNVGTAYVVDDHTILTVAHIIYQKKNNVSYIAPGLKFKVFSDYNTESDDYTITPVSYHVPNFYVNNAYTGLESSNQINDIAVKYDYAIVTVQEDLSDLVNFNLGIAREELPIGTNIYVTGFGGDCAGITPGFDDVKTTGYGNLITSNDAGINTGYVLRYLTDAVPGNSGSPVYVLGGNNGTSKTAIGVNNIGWGYFDETTQQDVYTCNQCVKITTDILHFIFNNSYLQTQ